MDDEGVNQIEQFIRGSIRRHFQAENGTNRKVPLNMMADSKVDVCLYLLGPNHISSVDVKTICAIGDCLPLVPLLAKGGNPKPLNSCENITVE